MHIVHSNTHATSCLAVDFIALLIQFSASVLSCLGRDWGGVGTHAHTQNICVHTNRDSSIGTMTGFGLENRRIMGSNPGRGEFSFFLPTPPQRQDRFRGSPSLIILNTGSSFPRDKVSGSMKLTTHLHLEPILRMCGFILRSGQYLHYILSNQLVVQLVTPIIRESPQYSWCHTLLSLYNLVHTWIVTP